MGSWGQCIIHTTLQPVWPTCLSDIHDWGNRSIVNHGSVMGGDWRKEAVLCLFCLFLFLYVCPSLSISLSGNICLSLSFLLLSPHPPLPTISFFFYLSLALTHNLYNFPIQYALTTWLIQDDYSQIYCPRSVLCNQLVFENLKRNYVEIRYHSLQ